jgi:D-3-phosphoglycerate dehydrogenase / 2-oxoglutarate reductase
VLGTRFVDFDVERSVVGDVEIVSGPGRSSDEVVEVAAGADVILAGAAPRFDASTLARLACRGIVRLGVGVDTVDLDAARSRGMWISYVPDYGTEAVALHTVSLILSALRRIPMADRRLRQGAWGFGDFRPLHLPSALTLGLVGYGRIGRRVGELAGGLGFGSIIATDPMLSELDGPGVELASMDRVLGEADVISLHAPPPPDGFLIGAPELASMKPASILVNTARGALIDTAALVTALKAGTPAVAALDVYHPEPPDVSLFESVADSVVLTPHMAWYTEETELELRRQGAAEARRILEGEPPLNPIVTPTSTEAP